jgi:hypothetical protein
MVRAALLCALALAAAACAAEPDYVVRLDLDEIAARTAARDISPGFTSLEG